MKNTNRHCEARKSCGNLNRFLSLILVMLLLFSVVPMTVSARIYEPHTWVLSFNCYANGGDTEGVEAPGYHKERENGSKAREMPDSFICTYGAPEGMKFKCWTNYCGSVFYYPGETDETSEKTEAFLKSYYQYSEDVNILRYDLYAVWESTNAPKTYTVGFCSLIPGTARQGNYNYLPALSVPGQYVGEGEKATVPVLESNRYNYYFKWKNVWSTVIEDETYDFKGWYTDPEFTERYDFDKPVTGNLTLYAKWELVPDNSFVTATFKGNGGYLAGLSMENIYDDSNPGNHDNDEYVQLIKVESGEELTVPECMFSSEKAFDCWTVGDKRYYPGDTIVMNSDKTIVANWADKGYTAEFTSNCGIGVQKDITVKEGEKLTLPECTFTAPGGMEFVGWQNGSNLYQPGDKVNITKDMTFEANWTDKDDTSEYDLWVGSTQVTGENRNDILGDGGSARFNPYTNTLTLNDPTITDSYEDFSVIYSEVDDLTVTGKATINHPDVTESICANNLTLSGDFNITADETPVFVPDGSLTIEDSTLKLCSASGGTALDCEDGDLTVTDSSVTTVDSRIWINGDVKTENSTINVDTYFYDQGIYAADGVNLKDSSVTVSGSMKYGVFASKGTVIITGTKLDAYGSVAAVANQNSMAINNYSTVYARGGNYGVMCTGKLKIASDTSYVEAWGAESSIMGYQGLTVGEGLPITEPVGGKVNDAKTDIVTSSGSKATHVVISKDAEPKEEKTDDLTGVKVTADASTELIVEPVEYGNITVEVDGDIAAAYDISLKKYGETVQPDGMVTVKIPCSDPDAKVYRVEADNSLTDMHATYEDGYLVFTTDHFSLYVVTGTSGFTVSGSFASCLNDAGEVSFELLQFESVKYSATATGNTGSYSIPGVAEGVYTLRVSKANHVTRDYVIDVTGDSTADVKIHPVGDFNGDGQVTTADVLRANSHAKRKKELTDPYQFACLDVVGTDKQVSTADVLRLNSHAKGKKLLW